MVLGGLFSFPAASPAAAAAPDQAAPEEEDEGAPKVFRSEVRCLNTLKQGNIECCVQVTSYQMSKRRAPSPNVELAHQGTSPETLIMSPIALNTQGRCADGATAPDVDLLFESCCRLCPHPRPQSHKPYTLVMHS